MGAAARGTLGLQAALHELCGAGDEGHSQPCPRACYCLLGYRQGLPRAAAQEALHLTPRCEEHCIEHGHCRQGRADTRVQALEALGCHGLAQAVDGSAGRGAWPGRGVGIACSFTLMVSNG